MNHPLWYGLVRDIASLILVINDAEERPMECTIENTDAAHIETIEDKDVAKVLEEDPGSVKVIVVVTPQKNNWTIT